MAKPVSYTKTPEDDDVILEMVEPSFQAKRASETTGLYFERSGSNKKVDYVLVYERCVEKENEDEESKEKAQKLEGMRTAFEESLKKAGLIIERVERASSQVSSLRSVKISVNSMTEAVTTLARFQFSLASLQFLIFF